MRAFCHVVGQADHRPGQRGSIGFPDEDAIGVASTAAKNDDEVGTTRQSVCIVSRRNILYVLMGIEMILNAASINFAAFNRFNGATDLEGRVFVIFIIILAAAEAAVALAIVLNVFHLFRTVKPSDADLLRE